MKRANDYAAKRLRSIKIKLAVGAFIFFITLTCGVVSYNYFMGVVNRPNDEVQMEFADGEGLEIDIPMGSGTQAIADILLKNGVIKQPKIFKVVSKINGYDGQYRSGTHVVGKSINYNSAKGFDDLMRILTANPVSSPTINVTIPEGYTYGQIVDLFVNKGLTTKEEFNAAANSSELDYWFLKDLPERENRLEGYLFPETYTFDTKGGAEHIIQKMLDQFEAVFSQKYIDRAEVIGKSADEIITLASIIEREAQAEEDRPIISGVFYNRLKSKDQSLHLLQSCATIQYIYLRDQGIILEQITQENTQIDDPYNTYKYPGLPPGPISCPGEASIIAALYPDTENVYYYFCAKGDGTHAFSKTFDEHVNNMIKYGQILN